jgi:hypothetical protein
MASRAASPAASAIVQLFLPRQRCQPAEQVATLAGVARPAEPRRNPRHHVIQTGNPAGDLIH